MRLGPAREGGQARTAGTLTTFLADAGHGQLGKAGEDVLRRVFGVRPGRSVAGA